MADIEGRDIALHKLVFRRRNGVGGRAKFLLRHIGISPEQIIYVRLFLLMLVVALVYCTAVEFGSREPSG